MPDSAGPQRDRATARMRTVRLVAVLAASATALALAACSSADAGWIAVAPLSGSTFSPGGTSDGSGNGMSSTSEGRSDPVIPVPDDAWPATVTYVHDGDTLYLSGSGRDERKTRLIGIDTPEIGERAECYGAAATELTRAFLPEGTAVLATNDLDPVDRYDRELVYLWLPDGTFVNLAIVELGAAEAVLFAPNDRYWDELRAAERDARDAGLGMWGVCR